ncbi:hypothetical protein ACE1CD_10435 [Aerosakkonema sp. BLCC-F183]|uniref:hypothetical protein n=1 Tax=Aerosakkonema sp. BLCC-F183 TaxID=3342834 RepID=UPI0035B8C57A
MIPLGDNIPSRCKPIVNYLPIGFNVAIFLWEIKLALTGELANAVKSFSIVPVRITTAIASGLGAYLIGFPQYSWQSGVTSSSLFAPLPLAPALSLYEASLPPSGLGRSQVAILNWANNRSQFLQRLRSILP